MFIDKETDYLPPHNECKQNQYKRAKKAYWKDIMSE